MHLSGPLPSQKLAWAGATGTAAIKDNAAAPSRRDFFMFVSSSSSEGATLSGTTFLSFTGRVDVDRITQR